MKKISYFLVSLFLIGMLMSCEKKTLETRLDYNYATSGTNMIVTNVGNTYCEDLNLGEGATSTGKVDYVNGQFVFEDPEASWEDWGLTVTVSEDGRSISFTSDLFCVGAVIAKGGNASNVYKYEGGIKGDVGLTPPVNSSGSPAALSNLSFCFVPCEKEPIYIAVKLAYWYAPSYIPDKWGGNWGWALSSVSNPITSGEFKLDYSGWDWCRDLGIIEYPTKTSSSLIASNTNENIGTVVIEPAGSDAIKVTVALKDNALMDKIYVYAGSAAGIGLGAPIVTCPVYTSWPNSDENNAYSYSFTIPY